MGRKCNVLHCLSDSRRVEDQGVTYHKMPTHPDLRPKWISLCKIPYERQTNKVIYVCSRHFLRADFCNFKGTKYMLRQGALPSVFPWSNNISKSQDSDVHSADENIDTGNIKSEVKSELEDDEFSDEDKKSNVPKIITGESSASHAKVTFDNFKVKDEPFTFINKMVKKIDESILDAKFQNNGSSAINFSPGTKIEAMDFNDTWYPANIVEVDYDDNEVLIHFEMCPSRVDEWIPMDSSRLRTMQVTKKNENTFEVGEKCMAIWSEVRKFPATVKRVIDSDTYEVLFDDGYMKILKTSKLFKVSSSSDHGKGVHASPLFDPVVGSKQERRDRKRKINVAELFSINSRKKNRYDDYGHKSESSQEDEKPTLEDIGMSHNTGSSGQYDKEEWTCRWVNGEPVGQESVVDSIDGPRPSVIVPDHRLPTGWIKHLSKRLYGTSAGKWDTFLISPEGRKFRTKHEIKIYIEENQKNYNLDQFDFGLHLNRARKLGLYEVTDAVALAAASPKPMPPRSVMLNKNVKKGIKVSTPKLSATSGVASASENVETEEETEEDENSGCLKIILENDSYKCPIEGCGKNFRKENLAQMHIKHYHPEYTSLLGSTPNVADLAYARTVGESIDDIVPKARTLPPVLEKPVKVDTPIKPKSTIKVLTPKIPAKPDENVKPIEKAADKNSVVLSQPTTVPKPATKDAEIIRLLNSDPKSKGIDSIFDPCPPSGTDIFQKLEAQEASVSKTPQDPPKYPDFKLKDLLKDSPMGKKDDMPRTSGIKTLLPVIRTSEEPKVEPPLPSEIDSDSHVKTLPAIKTGDKLRPGRKRRLSDNEPTKKRRQSAKYDTDEFSDYYEADSISQDSFKLKKSTELSLIPQESPQVIIEGGEVIKLVHMRREEIINCTCGITEEDGLMIQCELCLCWQHAHCNNISRESQVPEKYVCYICQNPQRMRASKKYVHDQDWLKQGTLATGNYHSKDGEKLSKKFEMLRKSHELSGSLIELNEFLHNLRIKLNIAENKDHPKLYLWAKPWDKTVPDMNLNILKQETVKIKEEIKQESPDTSFTNSDHSYIKSSTFGDLSLKSMLVPPLEDIKNESSDIKAPLISDDMKIKSQSELISILEDGNETKTDDDDDTKLTVFPKIDLNSIISNNLDESKSDEKSDEETREETLNAITGGLLSSSSLDLQLSQSDLERLSSLAQLSEVSSQPQPNIPQPEAAIDSSDCQMNLLDHIDYFQNLVDEKLNAIEEQITLLESQESSSIPEETEECPKTKQTLQMLIRDLSTMRRIATMSQ